MFRVEESGGTAKAEPVRKATSSLILIKARRGGEPVFLLRWSDAWGGYYWFVGGIQELNESADECAVRELNEELSVSTKCIRSMTKLLSVPDRRISSRMRVFTEYFYNVYSVALDDDGTCSALLIAEPVIQKTIKGGHPYNQRCKWHTWAEIKSSVSLMKDAGAVVQAIEAYGVDRIPLSITDDVI
ncbi:NUDIX hydrolase [Dechloromonas sp. A34]|uniref:NUDIX hydrolase n=1 Tax=Dechloromonas sp. A34 TaxID=447588 RepID=UPI00224941A1|nr:NUDIX hydrolase [Dechloromonas sp. A34]